MATFFELHGSDERFKKMTSYTLRRNYCHRAIDYCTRDDGSVDWDKAIQYTLHKSEKTLRASYEKRAHAMAHAESSEDLEEDDAEY